MKKSTFGSSIALLMLLLGVAAPLHAKENYFSIPREQVIAQVHRVGILPMTFEEAWPRRATAAQEFETLAIAELGKAQIEAVGSAAYLEIESRIKQEQGGWFDVQTGRVITAKRQLIRDLAKQDFIRIHNLDGLMQLRADVIKASVVGNKVIWHGHDEPARLPTGRGAFAQGLIDAAGGVRSGSLPALSVAVILSDKADKQLYGRYGALQMLTMIRDSAEVEFVTVDEQFVFADPLRNEQAIRTAIRQLVLDDKQAKRAEADEKARRSASRKESKGSDGQLDDLGRPLAPVVMSGESPATPALDAPLKVPVSDIVSRGKVIALTPITVAVGRPLSGRAEALESTLTKVLTDAGYTVVPSSVYRDAYVRNDEPMGPYFDAITGAELPGKVQALDRKVSEEMQASHQVALILHPAVVGVTALQDSTGHVRWDGVEQSISQSKNALAKFNASVNMATSTVPAISILVRILGVDQQELYVKRTGIQTLRKMGVLTMTDVPDADLLSDAEALRVAFAVVTADLGASSGTTQ
jgi:hypothetical protein